MVPILTVRVENDRDVALARHRARRIAALMGFPLPDQSRVATAVSEIARNACQYAGRGSVRFESSRRTLRVVVTDQGPGIRVLDQALRGRYSSPSGLGRGISGSRRIMHRFNVDSSEAGTVICMERDLPDVAPDAPEPRHVVAELTADAPADPLLELHAQNQSLLEALERLATHQEELQRTNDKLRVAREAAERAVRLRERTLAVVSHDLRSPLGTVDAALAIVARMVDDDTVHDRVTVGRRAVQRMRRLIDDLLDVASIEEGRLSILIKRASVSQILIDVAEAEAARAGEQRVELLVEPNGGVPEISCDPERLQQVFSNLVSNAIKFTPSGGRVALKARSEGGFVLVQVADTGPGIPEDALEHVFEPFYQSAVDRRGAGLGLAIVKGIVDAHGGRIRCDASSRGTTMSVWLPVGGPLQEVS